MSDPKYAGVGPVEVRLMEECAELIQAVSKAVRFGWVDWHPVSLCPNTANADREMADLIRCWNELAKREHLTIYEGEK